MIIHISIAGMEGFICSSKMISVLVKSNFLFFPSGIHFMWQVWLFYWFAATVKVCLINDTDYRNFCKQTKAYQILFSYQILEEEKCLAEIFFFLFFFLLIVHSVVCLVNTDRLNLACVVQSKCYILWDHDVDCEKTVRFSFTENVLLVVWRKFEVWSF